MPEKRKAKNAVGRRRKNQPISTPVDPPKPAPVWVSALVAISFALISGIIGAELNAQLGVPKPPRLDFLQHAQLLCRSDDPFAQWTPCIDKHGMFYDAQDRMGMELRIAYQNPMRMRIQ